MANEAQHSEWRKNIRENLQHAREYALGAKTPTAIKGQVEHPAMAVVAAAGAIATAVTSAAERIHEHTAYIAETNQHIHQLQVRNERISYLLDDFFRHIENAEPVDFEEIKDNARDVKARVESPDALDVDQRAADIFYR